MTRQRTAAIVVAGGSGRRMGARIPKQYMSIGGEPILLHAIRPFLECPGIDEVILVLPPEDLTNPPEWLHSFAVRLIAGGDERGDSVYNGVQAVTEDIGTILIHDGARPFVTKEIIQRVLSAALGGPAIAAIQVTDTIKAVDSNGLITGTLERSELWRAQTPQGFPADLIRRIHEVARRDGIRATDDAALCEQKGVAVRVVQGSPENLKITDRTDLIIAEAIAQRKTLERREAENG